MFKSMQQHLPVVSIIGIHVVIMTSFVGLVTLQGCGGARAVAAEKSALYMDCNVMSNSMNKSIQRCESSESVCYILENSSLSCLSKN